EDGFLRSVGLGAELARPLSWVLDRTGMYYDATRPSDLEQLLQSWEFTPQLLARAAALRERIVASGITKYSVGERAWPRPGRAPCSSRSTRCTCSPRSRDSRHCCAASSWSVTACRSTPAGDSPRMWSPFRGAGGG